MGRVIAVVMVAAMLAAGCSPALSRVRVGWGAGGVQVATGAAARSSPASTQDRSPAAQEPSPVALHVAAAKIPVGAKVKVRMRSGAELKGTLREVGSTGIVVQKPPAKGTDQAPGTDKAPVGANPGADTAAAAGSRATGETVEVPYEEMRSIQRDQAMGTAAKAALIAAGIAAAGLVIYQVRKGPVTGPSLPGGG